MKTSSLEQVAGKMIGEVEPVLRKYLHKLKLIGAWRRRPLMPSSMSLKDVPYCSGGL